MSFADEELDCRSATDQAGRELPDWPLTADDEADGLFGDESIDEDDCGAAADDEADADDGADEAEADEDADEATDTDCCDDGAALEMPLLGKLEPPIGADCDEGDCGLMIVGTTCEACAINWFCC